MSMLAEKRKKTRYVINPTKKPLWTTDSSGIKFGKELMEKMGWSAGKGLGANEQGIPEPLRISYKNDNKGMGYKGSEENWIECQDEFNVLLNQLTNNTDQNVKTNAEKSELISLEEKSKLSKARVHYQKFTRGKDISKYSENDLLCILGTGKLKKANNETAIEKEGLPESSTLENSFGVTTINSGSINDYFKKKWTLNNIKAANSNVEQSHEEQEFNERNDTDLKKKIKDRQNENKEESLKNEYETEGNEKVEETKKHKKKRKKLDLDIEITCNKEREIITETDDRVGKIEKKQLEVVNNSSEDILMPCIQDVVKTKKKKRNYEELQELSPVDVELKTQSEGLVNEKIKNKKRKKEKELGVNSFGESLNEEEINENVKKEDLQNETQKEDSTKKKKRKKEKESGVNSSGESLNEEEINENVKTEDLQNETQKENSTKKKKRKKEKESGVNSSGESLNEEEINENVKKEDLQNETQKEDRTKKKKRKKEKKSEELPKTDNDFETEVKEDTVVEELKSNTVIDADEKTIKKKKKNAELQEKDKSDCEEQVDNQKNLLKDAVEEVQEKKKKKKKKEKEVEDLEKGGLENDDNSPRENFPADTCKGKKKKKTCLEITEKEEEQMNEEIFGMEIAMEGTLNEKEKVKNSNKEDAEVQFQPEEVKKRNKKNKKEKKEKKCVNRDDQTEAETLENQDKESKRKGKSKSKSFSETVNTSEAFRETENEMSSVGKENENKSEKVKSKVEGEVTFIHTHKAALFQMRKPFVRGNFEKYSVGKALKLICGAEISKFKGANLESIPGYGYGREIENKHKLQ